MITVQQLTSERKAELDTWAKSTLRPNAVYRITYYDFLKVVSVEVHSKLDDKWYAVKIESI